MIEKVFCIGWAKTGTTSLGEALGSLGYNHSAAKLDLVEYLERSEVDHVLNAAAQYDSLDDWPWILLYRELDERFPGAKFILTVRDDASLLRSYRRMVAQEWTRNPRIREIRRFIYGFDTELGSDQDFLDRVRRHNFAAREYFTNRPSQLLEMDLSRGDGWNELCQFLDKPIPDRPFPRANSAESRPPIRTAIRQVMVKARLAAWRARNAISS